MRKLLAIWIAKMLIIVGKILGKKGSSAPGSFALRICPDILKILSAKVKKDIIVVLGTNGKTTTNNLIYSMLKSDGNKVVCNNVGANMLPGVVTAFIDKTTIWGKADIDYACLEIDELSSLRVFPHCKPNYIILTNLFRDQLDRYGEIDITIDALKRAADMAKDAVLILNGDDPLVTYFGESLDNRTIYYGVGEDAGVSLKETNEGRFCRFCGKELSYNYYHYSHLGNYFCDGCGFKRPKINYEAVNLDLNDGIAFDVNGDSVSVNYRGFYNIYNILACMSVVKELNLDDIDMNKVLSNYKPQIGRMQTYNIGKEVVFNLAKNPAGFNQAISTVLTDKRKKSIVVAINDNESDGIDISWLWDVDFERLADANVSSIYTSGMRHNDVSVRLKYAGFTNIHDGSDIKKAILSAKENDNEVIYLLVNYTMIFMTENILKELSQGYEK